MQLDDRAAPWSLEHCRVDPRCLRRGVGRALLARVRAAAAAAGETAVAIDADPLADPFYLALGARRVGEIAAPIAGQPGRVWPHLRRTVAARR